jgi:uncharacterized protein (DUF697 family)
MVIIGQDFADLERAKALLEKDSAAVKLATLFGDLAESIVRCLPQKQRRQIENACLVGLEKSWEFSVTTLSAPGLPPESEKQHRRYAILSGAVGGVGVATLFAELPVTTVIMMRAVADIAKSEGEDFRQFDTKIACLQVFALGSDSSDKTEKETGYYFSRRPLDQPLHESTRYIVKKGTAGMAAPFAVQVVAKIAARYQTWLSARTAAAAVPLAGAAMGAGINIIYLNYLHDKARGHFIVRRLERKYGDDVVERQYAAVQCGDRDATMPYSYPDEQQIDRIIKKHVYAAMGSGLLPVPLADFLLILGIRLNMLRRLAALYHLPFAKNRVKNLLGAFIGGAFSSSCGVRLGAGIAKIIPVIGQTVAVATVSASAGASTYAVGKVFNRHFAQGGTFLSFDAKEAAAFYQKMFTEGTDRLRNPAKL